MILCSFSTSLSLIQSINYTVVFVLAHAAIGDRPLAAALRLVDAARGSSVSLYSLQLTGSPERPPLFGGGLLLLPLLLVLRIAAAIRVCRAQPTAGDRARTGA